MQMKHVGCNKKLSLKPRVVSQQHTHTHTHTHMCMWKEEKGCIPHVITKQMVAPINKTKQSIKNKSRDIKKQSKHNQEQLNKGNGNQETDQQNNQDNKL